MRTYYFLKRLSDGIVGLGWIRFSGKKQKPDPRKDLWTRGNTRGRPKSCYVTGQPLLSGSMAWRPITNGDNRMDRISEAGIKQLEERAHAFEKKARANLQKGG